MGVFVRCRDRLSDRQFLLGSGVCAVQTYLFSLPDCGVLYLTTRGVLYLTTHVVLLTYVTCNAELEKRVYPDITNAEHVPNVPGSLSTFLTRVQRSYKLRYARRRENLGKRLH